MTAYQRVKSGRRVLITALYFFSSPFPYHFSFPFFSFPLHLKPLYMTEINKRQEKKEHIINQQQKPREK
jgi:hypothetical protein